MHCLSWNERANELGDGSPPGTISQVICRLAVGGHIADQIDAFLADIRDMLGRDPTDWGNGQVP